MKRAIVVAALMLGACGADQKTTETCGCQVLDRFGGTAIAPLWQGSVTAENPAGEAITLCSAANPGGFCYCGCGDLAFTH